MFGKIQNINNKILAVVIFTFIITGCSSSFHLKSEETNHFLQEKVGLFEDFLTL